MANTFYTEGTLQRYFQVPESDSESEHFRLKALSDTRGSYNIRQELDSQY